MKRWRTLTDHTVLLTASPETAMERENLGRLIRRQGSIMRPEELDNYNRVLERVKSEHADKFEFSVVDTSDSSSPLATGARLLEGLLPRLRAWVDPKIVSTRTRSSPRLAFVIPRSEPQLGQS